LTIGSNGLREKSRLVKSWLGILEYYAFNDHGDKMSVKNETIDFIRFVIDQFKQTEIYKSMHYL